MKISIDGGGVFLDETLEDGYRFRVSYTADSADDVTLYAEYGELHIVGQYAALLIDRVGENHVVLHSVGPVAPR